MDRKVLVVALASALAAGSMSSAGAVGTRMLSGSYDGLNWQASSYIVGVNPTGTLSDPPNNPGGDPIYYPSMPQHSGVAALIMDYGQAGRFICSGSLLPDRRSILTAAHCVSDGTSARPLETTAYFFDGDPNERVPFNPLSTAVLVSDYFVNAAYTGDVIDHNDIAVLRLAEEAPAFATSYDLAAEDDLTGLGFDIAGYGGRSTVGGDLGVDSRTGWLRQGDNRYEYRLGDADFTGGWELIFGLPTSQIGFSYLSDFDNGLAANDTSCLVAADPFFALAGPKYCNTGVGVLEVSVGGGDSGGPQFINNRISSVTSYGLSFGPDYGDILDGLQSSFGEFNGFVPTYLHRDFIYSVMVPSVPEPGSLALLGLGLASLGFARRRRS